ncbi:hypothetical protein [Stigmatella erecta]|uniref:Uncharacterized protein n=1 Tax=Stigmatella erecta TaxID=83460 RepID=A0A1I0IUP6_9BACT|nr:hypothetical protein [Stigmatella erecta]SEU00307.1 hypothetical protein SAMN05443639_106259 [Stigmatella erecta]
MAARMTRRGGRWLGAVLALGWPVLGLAAAPGVRPPSLTPLEESLQFTPEGQPVEERQPVLGYLSATPEGWQLAFPPGGVLPVGAQPAPTDGVDAALESLPSNAIAPHLTFLRWDF